MSRNFYKLSAIIRSIPSRYREILNANRHITEQIRVFIIQQQWIYRILSQIRAVFSSYDTKQSYRPESVFRLCNEDKSVAYFECCYCGGLINLHNLAFRELFSSLDGAENSYAKDLFELTTKKLLVPVSFEEMAECCCYASDNTENIFKRLIDSERKARRQRFQIIKGTNNA